MSRKNKMKNKDFEKARDKNIGSILFQLLFGAILFLFSNFTYGIDLFICLMFFVFGVMMIIFSLHSLIVQIESGTNPERYTLCKRCKCLVKKDKIFCSDCKSSIRISLKRDKNKKYFKEYETLIKKEKKK